MAQTYNQNTTTAAFGNYNPAVAALQTELNKKGANLKVDAKYGPLTQAAVAKYGNVTPTTPTNVVNSQNIAPVSPIPLPDTPNYQYGGLQGATEALVGQAKAQEQAKQETPAQDNYLKAILESGNISSSVDRTEQDKALKESNKYLAMLEQEQLANRRRTEAFEKSFTGTTAGAAAGLDKLNRDSLSKQADIAILQTAANRNYDTAASIADRAVQLKLEQSKANLEALKLLDSREYGDIQAKKEREYKILDRNENAIAELKLKVAQYAGSSAPSILSKLSSLDTSKPGAFDEAVAIAGKYAEDPLDRQIRQAQLNKLTSEIGATDAVSTKILSTSQFKAAQAAQNLKNTLTKAQEAVAKYGNREVLSGEGKGILDTLKVQLRSEISTALEQGVVVPGEAASFDAIAGELNKSFGIRNKKTVASLQSLSDSMDSRIKTQKAALTGTYKVKPEQIDSLLGIVSRVQSSPQSEEDAANQYMQAGANLIWDALETEGE